MSLNFLQNGVKVLANTAAFIPRKLPHDAVHALQEWGTPAFLESTVPAGKPLLQHWAEKAVGWTRAGFLSATPAVSIGTAAGHIGAESACIAGHQATVMTPSSTVSGVAGTFFGLGIGESFQKTVEAFERQVGKGLKNAGEWVQTNLYQLARIPLEPKMLKQEATALVKDVQHSAQNTLATA